MAAGMTTLSETFITDLNQMALDGLVPLYDQERKLFAYQIQNGQRVPMKMAFTITYTAITLLGLQRARQSGLNVFDVDTHGALKTLMGLIADTGWSGDVGLILWADAHHGGENRAGLVRVINRLVQDGNLLDVTTMELSWMLIGLSYTYQIAPDEPHVERLAHSIFAAIEQRTNAQTFLYPHTGGSGIRSQIGNFADQIYTIYALATYYETFKQPEALRYALNSGRRILGLQGPQGQWWWHYHAGRGVVVARYPVFGVHQDGMAPMALYKLASVADDADFSALLPEAITRSLAWLLPANNELNHEMIDWTLKVVWRDIERAKPADYLRYVSMGLAEVGVPGLIKTIETVEGFTLNPEMRPYHLGWLLYAFADKATVNG